MLLDKDEIKKIVGKYEREPIALIGIGCRFPGGSTTPEAFWDVMKNGIDAVTEIPSDRWSNEAFYHSKKGKKGKSITKWGGFLDNIDKFDPQFFGISPREASFMDPQQRLLLKASWEAFEDAGQVPSKLVGSNIGVFMGAFTLDYKIMQFGASNFDMIDTHTAVGSMMTIISNRISHAFDLRGPSLSVDTACSSSLVATHLACNSIWNGECSLALAGGVLLMCTPQYTIAESQGGFLSPDGRSKAFDSRANGYVRGEGAGVIALKPLSKALEDGDEIYSIIRGTAVNQDGATKGITVPRGDSQKAVIKAACENAGVKPHEIQYVEAHGTGTPVGDPIEANSLGTVLSEGRPGDKKCVIGSVKTNIGHLEAAAGVAGLIKASLCLKKKQIPKHLHLITPNPEIDLDALQLHIPTELMPWPEHEGPALAGVNSFGFGGTNAHVVLEEAPKINYAAASDDELPKGPYLLPLTTRSEGALKDLAKSYVTLIESEDFNARLYDLNYTATHKRDHHNHRMAVVANSLDELKERLSAYVNDEATPGIITGKTNLNEDTKLAVVFSGMGPQWWGMGRQMIETEPLFKDVIEKCDKEMSKYADWSLMEEMMRDEETSRMAETQIAQPCNFAIQAALFAFWQSKGIKADVIVGHSTGEVAAQYAAGVLSFEDAIKVIYHRSMLQQTLAGTGKMAAVGVTHQEALELIKGHEDKVAVAAVNSPGSVTLAGDGDILDEIAAPLEGQGIFCKFLKVEVPFHSPFMEPIKDKLLAALADIKPQKAATPLYSTVTGGQVEGPELDAGYWWSNVRNAVLFTDAMDAIIAEGYTNFLEVGPHPVLSHSIKELLMDEKKEGTILSSLRRKENEPNHVYTTLGGLYTIGCALDWQELYPVYGKHVELPLYPWQRESYWVESDFGQKKRLGDFDHPLLGLALELPVPVWESELDPEKLPFLNDHVMQGSIVYPAAGYIEMALEALDKGNGPGVYTLKDINFSKALFISHDHNTRVNICFSSDRSNYKITSLKEDGKEPDLYSFGRIVQFQDTSKLRAVDLEGIKSKCTTIVNGDECYTKLGEMGYQYGPMFQAIDRIFLGGKEVLAKLAVPEQIKDSHLEYQIHPAVLDACFQTMLTLEFEKPEDDKNEGEIRLPVGIEEFTLYRPYTDSLHVHSYMTFEDESVSKGNIIIYNDHGEVVAEIIGFTVQALDSVLGNVPRKTLDSWIYSFDWEEKGYEAKEKKEDTPEETGVWIVLGDNKGYGETLVSELSGKGNECILVKAGSTFSFDAESAAGTVKADSKEDFLQLINEAIGDKEIKGVAHLWNLDIAPTKDLTIEAIENNKILGSFSVIRLIQGLTETGKSPAIWFMTKGAQPIGEDYSELSSNQASVWGIGRVIGNQEFVGLWGGMVDLDPAGSPEDIKTVITELLDSDGEDQIAYRGDTRFVARVNNVKNMTATIPPEFKPNGAYLVTGAFGALGKLTVRWMIKKGVRRVVLMGRSPLPPRNEWASIDREENKNLADRIDFVKEVENRGVSVHVAAVDLTKEDQLTAFMEDYKNQGWPEIKGVISIAGVVQDQLLTQMDEEVFDSVYDPKVIGTWLLHKAFEKADLDFFVIYSSIAAIVTSTGQANYAAANAFLDSLSHYRRLQGLPALSIGWGPWAIGMIKELNLEALYKRRGLDIIYPEPGMQVLERMIGQNIPYGSVVSADWARVIDSGPRANTPYLDHLAMKDGDGDETLSDADIMKNFLAAYGAAEEDGKYDVVSDHMADIISKVLHVKKDSLDVHTSLNSLGIDSMMATELKNRVELNLGITLTIVDILNNATIAGLAEIGLGQVEEKVNPKSVEELVEEAGEEDLEAMMAELENMSEEEAAKLLAEVE